MPEKQEILAVKDQQVGANQKDEDTKPVKKAADIWFFVLEFLSFAIGMFLFLYAVVNEKCYGDFICFRNLMLGCFACAVSLCLLILTQTDRFDQLVKWLQCQSVGKVRLQSIIIGLFLVLALTDFLLLSVSVACPDDEHEECDDPLLDPDGGNGEVRHLTRTLTAICAIMFVFTILAFWDHFSFISAHSPWVHAMFWCTIIGGVILEVARFLVPPKPKKEYDENTEWSWHVRHDLDETLDCVMLIVLGLTVMFVWLAAIIVALFTEIANVTIDWGVSGATVIYCILALILGVTPLAPGSVADAVGGFLLVQIYMNEGCTFFEAIMIAFGFVTVLHFVGSCFQYFIGRVKAVQEWANFALPPDILAASDSVLLEANCLYVGLVGQVFMDTFNGLNQGRMNMNFVTQFWSEYASLPTAFSWVATGAVISVQGDSSYSWASDAIPICLLMAATWQFLGTTFGGYKLLKANKDEKFWKNKEKWETVQYFSKLGIKATKVGWKADCFCLMEKENSILDDPLFKRIEPIHREYVKIAVDTNENVKLATIKIAQKKYNAGRAEARENHWSELKQTYFDERDGILRLKDDDNFKDWWLIFEAADDSKDQDEWRQKKWFSVRWKHSQSEDFFINWQIVLVMLAVITGIWSYISIAMDIETKVAVQQGFNVLANVGVSAWCVFIIYNIVVLIYYWRSFWNSALSGWHYTLSALRCECFSDSHSQLETTFTPIWSQNDKSSKSVTNELGSSKKALYSI